MYTLIRSARKTIALELTRQGDLIVRAPNRMPEREIRAFVASKEAWIRAHREKLLAAAPDEADRLGPAELKRLAEAARADLSARARHWAGVMGLRYGKLTIRSQTTRWGSCSAKGNLNFNCLLMLAPEAERDYVVVHELSHLRHMDHSPAFWAEVEAVLPDYRARVAWFKANGAALMRRMTG